MHSARVAGIVASVIRGISESSEFGGFAYRVAIHDQSYSAVRVYYANGEGGEHYKIISTTKNVANEVMCQLRISRYRSLIHVG